MTIATASEPDFFSLHTRKPKTIDVEMLDYGFVERCTDLDELKGILAMLRSGKEGRYPDLEKATEDRILAVLPERERTKITRMRCGPTANELTTEIDELASWAAAMDVKNEALKRQTPFKRELPPVRGQKSSREMQSEWVRAPTNLASTKKAEQKKAKTIPAYDFRSWEKYDVDKALDEIDQESERAREQARMQQEEQEKRAAARKRELESLSKSVDLEKLQPETRKLYAGYEKQKGNDCFKANELEMALLHYTRSMAYDDTDAILYANRALGKYAESVQDFEEALRLEPENREVTKLMKAAKEKHEEVNGALLSNQMSPTNHEADENEEKPFKRFEIIEDDDGEEISQQNQPCKRSSMEKPFTRFEIIEAEGSEDEDDD
ncbi:Heat stress transcription factor A-3 [Phytophthora nicotianae]|uniref:Heat stress transcription factor A-3 n=1 Tax=Phytophthora nicotianae TaxID=4792 RepID=A0A0W8DJK2_PHYNI|nr:Heat stress transcription factor A-3 [Phytophthora nicotianae]